MKEFFQRIKIFWGMYIMFFVLFFIGALFILIFIHNQYLYMSLMTILALILIALSVSSIVLPKESKLLEKLYGFAKVSKSIIIVLPSVINRYSTLSPKRRRRH